MCAHKGAMKMQDRSLPRPLAVWRCRVFVLYLCAPVRYQTLGRMAPGRRVFKRSNSMPQSHEGPRVLTSDELADLQREMAISSAWMKAELKRRHEASDQAHAELVNDAMRGLNDVSAGRVGDADALLAKIQSRRRASD
jgi:hypothetical protein